ncbi:MAG: hypothetical protein WBG50_26650 [Desulfomonilaceae bacterium]
MTQTNPEMGIKRAAADSARQYLDLALPYHFSNLARRTGVSLRRGDHVRIRGLQKHRKFQLVDIYPEYGWVRVREVGGTEPDGIELGMPWHHVEPWKREIMRSNTMMQAVGDWLFGKNLVYRVSEPDRMLKTLKVKWDSETSDVQAQDGTVFRDVPWDELDFWDPEDYHLAGE